MSLTILTPLGALIALGVVVPLVALRRIRRRAGSTRTTLGLPQPRRRSLAVPVAGLVVGGILIALAATQPVLEWTHDRTVRTDAEAFVVLDVSRSMLAQSSLDSPQRIERAKAAADRAPSRASGRQGWGRVAHRPCTAASVPERGREGVRGDRRPLDRDRAPAPPLVVPDRGDVPQRAREHSRSALLHPDVEVASGDRAHRRRERWCCQRPARGPLQARPGDRPRLRAVLGRGREGVLTRRARAAHKPNPGARGILDRLAASTTGAVYSEDQIGAAERKTREFLGRGPTAVQGERAGKLVLAPYLALAALFPFGLLLWRRDR